MLRFNDDCTRLDHKTFKLLCYFVAHHDQIVERRDLMDHLWENQHPSDASLGRLISVLRKILAINGHKFIFTIHKTGYRFVIPADVQFIAANPTLREVPAANIHAIETKLNVEVADKASEQAPTQAPAQAQAPALALVKQSAPQDTPVSHERSSQPVASASALQPASIGIKHLLPWYLLVILLIIGGMIWDLTTKYFAYEQNAQGTSTDQAISISNRIVILPFEQLSEHQDNIGFMQGIAAELVVNLVNIDGLQVVDKHKSSKYDSAHQEITHIAAQLQARYVLKGYVRIQQDVVRVSVQVVDSVKGNTLFSAVFEPDINEGFDAQIRIAKQVAQQLKTTLVDEIER